MLWSRLKQHPMVIAAGALMAGLATFFGVLQAPLVVRDLHRWICSSESLHSTADRLSECPAPEGKTPTVIIDPTGAGAAVALGIPVPAVQLYDSQRQQFLTAARDEDTAFLDHLKNSGFKIRKKDVCSISKYVGYATEQGPPKPALDMFLESASDAKCSGRSVLTGTSESGKPLDRYLLDEAILEAFAGDMNATGGCRWRQLAGYWSLRASFIEAIIAAYGRSPAFIDAARGYLAQLKAAATAKRSDVVAACLAMVKGGPHAAQVPVYFSNTCINISGTRLSAQTSVSASGIMGEAGSRDERYARALAGACDARVPKSGYAADVPVIRASLEKWSK
jgi:hypothetical protein